MRATGCGAIVEVVLEPRTWGIGTRTRVDDIERK
jgi:hypothetical protein